MQPQLAALNAMSASLIQVQWQRLCGPSGGWQSWQSQKLPVVIEWYSAPANNKPPRSSSSSLNGHSVEAKLLLFQPSDHRTRRPTLWRLLSVSTQLSARQSYVYGKHRCRAVCRQGSGNRQMKSGEGEREEFREVRMLSLLTLGSALDSKGARGLRPCETPSREGMQEKGK